MLERINIVPRKPLASKIRRMTALLLVLIGATLASAIAFDRQQAMRQLQHIQNETATVLDLERKAQDLQDDLARANQRLEERRAVLAALETRLQRTALPGKRQHPLMAPVLALIAESVPETVRLDALTLRGDRATVQGATLEYEALPLFIGRLQKDPRFADIVLKQVQQEAATQPPSFNFTLELALAR